MRMLILFILTFTLSFSRCYKSVRTFIPPKAKYYQYYILENNLEFLPDEIVPWYFDALIEHETCITLCNKKCWNPKARLRTKREEGAGLGQLTRVFRKNGTVRWDTIRTLKMRYPKLLKNLTWKNVYNRPDLQIRALILLWKNDYRYYKGYVDKKSVVWFADSAYNGGFKWLNRERELCKFTKHCDPKKWFGNVARIKSRRAIRKLYGNRTAWDINRHHTRSVYIRTKKYKDLLKSILEN